MVYKWSIQQFSVDANVVGKALESIEAEHGAVTAELLVKKATPVDSELHSLFEWNNKKAAEKWRLQQARVVIASVKVVYEEKKEEPITTRAFVNVGTKRRGQFITTATALSDEKSREIVLKHALQELAAFKAKYAGLEELSVVFSEIEKLSGKGAA